MLQNSDCANTCSELTIVLLVYTLPTYSMLRYTHILHGWYKQSLSTSSLFFFFREEECDNDRQYSHEHLSFSTDKKALY